MAYELQSASSARNVRIRARSGEIIPTCGLALRYLQANLVIVPKSVAFVRGGLAGLVRAIGEAIPASLEKASLSVKSA